MNRVRTRLMSISTVAICLVFTGCASPPAKAPPPTDEVRVALEKSMERISQMPAHTGHADAKAPEATLKGNSITIRSYQNDASKLLARVAAARGMKFLVNGPEPRLPLFVSVDIENATLEEFLGAVGYQFGQRADLILTNDTIEIRYRGM